MTYIVALTGGIGSGKTTISNSFKKIGVNIIDADSIGRKIIKHNLKVRIVIKKKFGKKILNTDDSINRSLLRKNILENKNDRLWLENLLHPKIYQETKNRISLTKTDWCLWVVPLLIEKKLENRVNRILLVDTPIKNQIKRIIKRDQISIEEAKKIISLQTTREKRISISDDIIFNKKEIEKLEIYVYYLNSFYTYLAKQYQKKHLGNFKKNYLTKFY